MCVVAERENLVERPARFCIQVLVGARLKRSAKHRYTIVLTSIDLHPHRGSQEQWGTSQPSDRLH